MLLCTADSLRQDNRRPRFVDGGFQNTPRLTSVVVSCVWTIALYTFTSSGKVNGQDDSLKGAFVPQDVAHRALGDVQALLPEGILHPLLVKRVAARFRRRLAGSVWGALLGAFVVARSFFLRRRIRTRCIACCIPHDVELTARPKQAPRCVGGTDMLRSPSPFEEQEGRKNSNGQRPRNPHDKHGYPPKGTVSFHDPPLGDLQTDLISCALLLRCGLAESRGAMIE